jgi:redox-sensitive bicupin YhaK (pirin superfamily)
VLTPTHTIGAQFDPTKKRLGVGQHPHRGFETVTVAFQGAVEHQDSTGNNDVIGPGDVQWMTAGRGIIHEEYHSTEFAKSGGIFEMCQLWGNDSNPNPEPNPNPNPNPTNPNPNILSPTRALIRWVNLPKKHKMHAPRYQPILSAAVPVVQLKEAKGDAAAATTGDATTTTGEECAAVGSVRVIAGELDGVRGPAQTFTPILLWDATLTAQGAVVELPVRRLH